MKFGLQKLMSTTPDVGPLIIRLGLAIVIFPHGAQKVFGWFGGHGPAWTIEMWQQWWGLPVWLTVLVMLAESAGAIALAAGFIGRFMAACIGAVMLGAMWLLHLQSGFFMNWYAQAGRGEGFEYHLLVLAMVLLIFIKGSGTWSVDLYLHRNREQH